tara:strand:+ start:2478 stop:2825 length:348 start_codon:yes stop_codon:yes gene_type:complete
MEYVSCNVAIGGDVGQVVCLNMVSSPELIVLKSIHGDSSLSGIKITGEYTHSDDDERDRLKGKYGEQRVSETLGQFGEMPKTLKETRIPDTYYDPLWLDGLKKETKKKPATKKEK